MYNYFRRVAIILINFQIGTGFRIVMNEVSTSDNPTTTEARNEKEEKRRDTPDDGIRHDIDKLARNW